MGELKGLRSPLKRSKGSHSRRSGGEVGGTMTSPSPTTATSRSPLSSAATPASPPRNPLYTSSNTDAVCGSPSGGTVDYEAVLMELVDAIVALQVTNDDLLAKLAETSASHSDATKAMARAQRTAERHAVLLEDENSALRTRLEAEAGSHAAEVLALHRQLEDMQRNLQDSQQQRDHWEKQCATRGSAPSTQGGEDKHARAIIAGLLHEMETMHVTYKEDLSGKISENQELQQRVQVREFVAQPVAVWGLCAGRCGSNA
jgi:hypothetical protein